MNCIIIDDELTARTIINQLCSKAENLVVLEEFSNAIEAIKYLNKNEVDLIFLDVHMPGFTGFDFIETLKNPPRIILTTSDVNFAIEAFVFFNREFGFNNSNNLIFEFNITSRKLINV